MKSTLSPAEARTEFIATISRIGAMRDLQTRLQSETQDRFDETLIARFREKFGKRRKASRSIAWAALPEVAKALFESEKTCLGSEAAQNGCSPADIDVANEHLKALALTAEILPGTEPHLFHQVAAGDYHTQGFGAATYAKADADRVCGKVLAHGVRAEVISQKAPGSIDYLSTAFEVHVWPRDPSLPHPPHPCSTP